SSQHLDQPVPSPTRPSPLTSDIHLILLDLITASRAVIRSLVSRSDRLSSQLHVTMGFSEGSLSLVTPGDWMPSPPVRPRSCSGSAAMSRAVDDKAPSMRAVSS